MELEEILDVMGCKTRREILSLLTQEPRFVSQISRELDIGQKAIIEHLRAMEELGILRSSFRKIERGRPRKYYDISQDIKIQIFISHDTIETHIIGEEVHRQYTNEFSELSRIEKKIQLGNMDEAIEDLKIFIQKCDEIKKYAQSLLESLKSDIQSL
ncbi:MAG: ArsR family transcriptional regulator [Euryarchaeota archaeon]|nr:ArsR family transcriptional regulator [Euryarchaeota archaeon]